MARYIDADEFEKRIKPYDTNDSVDKALYNFAHNKMLDTSTADVVERSAYDQVRWERDTAIEQLRSIGKGFGETMDDVVERKRGKWIRESLVTDYPYKCSACKKYSRARYDFCPSCGADMRENGE